MAISYMETFNSEPWNDRWTLGSMEQFFNGIMSNVKKFWGKNGMRGLGIGMEIFKEFERRIVKNGVNEIILFTSKGAYT